MPGEERAARPAEPPGHRWQSEQVLVVTTDVALAGEVAAALASDGLPVGYARDGEEALRRLAHQRPVAVVLDLEVPVVSGHRVLRVLATDPDTRTVPVVVLAGSLDEVRGVCRTPTAVAPARLLPKPVSPTAVAAQVRQVLAA